MHFEPTIRLYLDLHFGGPYLKSDKNEGLKVIFGIHFFFLDFLMGVACLGQNFHPGSFFVGPIIQKMQTYILGAVEIFHTNFHQRKIYQKNG